MLFILLQLICASVYKRLGTVPQTLILLGDVRSLVSQHLLDAGYFNFLNYYTVSISFIMAGSQFKFIIVALLVGYRYIRRIHYRICFILWHYENIIESIFKNKVLSTTWLAVITEGKLEDRKSRQLFLFSPITRDFGERYHYDNPYYPLLPFPGSDTSESTNFNNQARVPSIRTTSFSSSMFPTGR